ncbi:hypothetical protein CALCODRAFT_502708 [Calocera cornea HHB12733]|uniref:Uncharacterized protein n=1 Tax=Calocera cornea HHB12733 TaxID=1353952 RepID=A0A165D5E1_9BASI|nr:hypothetical protein CALCODRAFT_502708 [Calocera cornea HHB12733]
MSFGDVSSTDLENLFADMEIMPFGGITRRLQWVASGLSMMTKVDYNIMHTIRRTGSTYSLESHSASKTTPVVLGVSTK